VRTGPTSTRPTARRGGAHPRRSAADGGVRAAPSRSPPHHGRRARPGLETAVVRADLLPRRGEARGSCAPASSNNGRGRSRRSGRRTCRMRSRGVTPCSRPSTVGAHHESQRSDLEMLAAEAGTWVTWCEASSTTPRHREGPTPRFARSGSLPSEPRRVRRHRRAVQRAQPEPGAAEQAVLFIREPFDHQDIRRAARLVGASSGRVQPPFPARAMVAARRRQSSEATYAQASRASHPGAALVRAANHRAGRMSPQSPRPSAVHPTVSRSSA